ncbi:MAG: tyrosine-type recombinase/integrase [Bacteroidales bacterium]|nr:tyrosine-type recombinase/integrase [Bacteroidales bacterium]
MIQVYDEEYNKLAKELKNHFEILGHSKYGAINKYKFIMEFFHQLEQKGINDIKAVNSKEIAQHYKYLQQRTGKAGKLSEKSIYTHMTAVQQLFSYLLRKGTIKTDPGSALKFPYPNNKSERIILTQNEIQELYKVSENHQQRAILSLAYGCGLRSFELEAINIEDIKLRQGILIVPRGKGNKRRVVPISSRVIQDLENYYFKEREQLSKGRNYEETQQAFMLHSRGGRMMKYTYNKYLKRIIERTGNQAIKSKNITIHNLRHSIATHLLEQGVKVEQVREFLGHSQLETTEIYTRVGQKQLQKLVEC